MKPLDCFDPNPLLLFLVGDLSQCEQKNDAHLRHQFSALFMLSSCVCFAYKCKKNFKQIPTQQYTFFLFISKFHSQFHSIHPLFVSSLLFFHCTRLQFTVKVLYVTTELFFVFTVFLHAPCADRSTEFPLEQSG